MRGILMQTLVTLIISVLSFLGSYGNAWSSHALKLLESEESPLGYKITKQDSSLIGSIVMLGSLASLFFVRYLSEGIGRKRTMMLCGLIFTLGWCLIATAKTVTQLLIGRFIIGAGAGLYVAVSLIYINEFSDKSIRGSLASILAFTFNIGLLAAYIGGWMCSYDVINYIGVTTAVAFLLMFCWVKETPTYLMRNGMEKEALNSMKFYRGKSTVTEDILDEINYLRTQQRTNGNSPLDNANETPLVKGEHQNLNVEKEILEEIVEHQTAWSILRSSKSARHALITLSLLMVMCVNMGMYSVQAYAEQFFSEAAPNLSSNMCSILLASLITISSGVSVAIMDLVPRRVLMISSCFMSFVCMAVLASMLRWAWAPQWAIPLIMALYCISYNMGTVNVLCVQSAECFVPQIKSFASSVIFICMFMASFVLLYLFGSCVETLGLDGTFFMFSIISLLTALTSFLFMRETKRVPPEEIQAMFEKGYLYSKKSKCLEIY